MTTKQHLELANALCIYLHGKSVEMYFYNLNWFKIRSMPFQDQPINYN